MTDSADPRARAVEAHIRSITCGADQRQEHSAAFVDAILAAARASIAAEILAGFRAELAAAREPSAAAEPTPAEPKPAAPKSTTHETAWLIERRDVALCYSQDGSCHRWVTFTDPAAWRFDTQTRAEMLIAERGIADAHAVEHGWVSPPPAERAPKDAPLPFDDEDAALAGVDAPKDEAREGTSGPLIDEASRLATDLRKASQMLPFEVQKATGVTPSLLRAAEDSMLAMRDRLAALEREMAEAHKELIAARQDLTIERQAFSAAESQVARMREALERYVTKCDLCARWAVWYSDYHGERRCEEHKGTTRHHLSPFESEDPRETIARAALAPSAPEPTAATTTGEQWRPEVVAFADAMERELRENDHKGGWSDDAATSLVKRLREEVDELAREVKRPHEWATAERWQTQVLSEAADVANFAMMIADVCGAIPTRGEASKTTGEQRSGDAQNGGDDAR